MFKSKLIRRTFIFVLVIIVFFLFDQLTKYFLFDKENQNVAFHDWRIIGIRSNFHGSTTFFDAINVSLPMWAIILISFFVISVLIVLFYFFNNTLSTIGIAVSLAGTLGNTVDNVFDGGVRNIIFIPIMDRGTFNLADLFIVLGGFLFLIGVLINYLLENRKKSKEQNEG